ncbi:tetratricopeptide repeat-containing sensor histidine kinase [Polaribacter uvawellassae]|uniref:tetratricopeptide repeat-containing sensor histidine kinase n=1 Tax=Polaribacter uvawellassae TaxID=3133495 RepID=UPI00321A72E5
MKKISVFFFLFVFCGNLFSQTDTTLKQKKDSLLFYYKTNTKDSLLLKKLKRATELASDIKDDSLIMQTNVKYGIQSYFKNKTEGLDFAQKNLNQLYINTKDSFALAKVYHYKALIHLINVKLDSSIYYYHQSKNISILIKDSLEVGRRLLSMSYTLNKSRDYLGSEILAIEGVKFLEPINDTRYLESLYIAIAVPLDNTGRYEEARSYYKKALEVNKKNPNKSRKIASQLNILNNIGRSYNKEKKYKKAISYLLEGLSFDDLEEKYPDQYQFLLGNLSVSYFNLGNKKIALEGYLKVLKSREKHNSTYNIAISHDILSYYYSEEKNFAKALFHARKSLEYSEKSGNIIRKLNSFSKLSNLESPKKAKIYFRKYIKLNDSLIKNERALKNQFARIRYETDKIDNENKTLKIENDNKQLEIEKEKQQKLIGFLLATASLLFLGISFLVFKNRRKKLAFETQLQKAEAREQERQQIAKSLHDEVAGDLRVLHQQLEQANQTEVANKLDVVKNNVRNLSHQLSSVHFDEVTFKDQMINLISDYFSANCKISINGLKENDWSKIANPIKRTLYLSARESIQNSKKHANATQIKIDLKQDKNNVYLTVKDNGVGFDLSAKVTGIGLKNQRERIEELKGKIEIISQINIGTTTKIEIPLNA